MKKLLVQGLGVAVVLVLAAVAWAQLQRAPKGAAAGGREAARRTEVVFPAGQGPGTDAEAEPRGGLWLEGEVTDASGDPVAGAVIQIDSLPPRRVTSDDSGLFQLDGLLARRYALTATADGLAAGPVAVVLRPDTEPLHLVMRPAARLVVAVQDADGAPVRGASVALRGPLVAEQAVAEDGRAAFAAALPGAYAVWATAEGFAPSVVTARIPAAAEPVALVIRLDRGRPVSGRVVDEAGLPLAAAKVVPVLPGVGSPPGQAPAITGDDGRFALAAVPTQAVRLSASLPGYADAGAPLPDGDDEVQIVLTRGATVEGRVLDEGGAPVAGALVRAALVGALEEARQWQTTSDERGDYALEGLPLARLEVVALHPVGASEPGEVDAARGGTHALDLVLPIAGYIRGRVVDGEGEPVPHVRVVAHPELRGRGGSLAAQRIRGELSATTDAEGRFALEGLRPGGYVLRPLPAGASEQTSILRAGTRTSTGRDDVEVRLLAGGTIRGRLVDARGEPVAGYGLRVDIAAVVPQADAEGRFEVEDVAPGLHTLTLLGEGFASLHVDDVQVASGAVTDLGDLEAPAGRRIEGVVLDADLRPVAGARVVAGTQLLGSSDALGEPMGLGGELGSTKARTDAEGRFALEGLDAGTLVVAAEHPDAGRSAGVEVGTGGEPIVLHLRATAVLEGRVLREGRPAAGVFVEAHALGVTRARAVVTTDREGRYRFERLAAGPTRVTAKVMEALDAQLATSEQLELGPAERHEIELRIEAGGGQLTVEFDAAHQGPHHQALLYLVPGAIDASTAGALEAAMASGDSGGLQTASSIDGEPVLLRGIEPGPHTLCAILVAIDPEDPRALRTMQRDADSMPVVCERVEITEGEPAVVEID